LGGRSRRPSKEELAPAKAEGFDGKQESFTIKITTERGGMGRRWRGKKFDRQARKTIFREKEPKHRDRNRNGLSPERVWRWRKGM